MCFQLWGLWGRFFHPEPAVCLFTVCWAGSKGTKLLWEVKLPLHHFNQEKFLLPWFSS